MAQARRAPAAKTEKVKVAGSVLHLDPEDLTLGELEEFEDIAGRPLQAMMKGEVAEGEDGKPLRDPKGKVVREVVPRAKELTAMVYLAKRRDDPDFTLADARNVKVSELVLGSADPQ